MTGCNPRIPPAATAHGWTDDVERAAQALRIGKPLRDPRLARADELIMARNFGAASRLLKECLRKDPKDAQALHLWAQALSAVGRHDDAQALLAKCLEIEPDFVAARYARGIALLNANQPEAALAEIDALLRREPRNPMFRALKAEALASAGNHSAAAAFWRPLTEKYPGRPEYLDRYGRALRAMGRLDDCIEVSRKRVELDPSSGRGWWNLADLASFRAPDIERMEAQLALPGISADDRIHLHFALGRAYAQLKLFEQSFTNYAKGNAVCRAGNDYDPQVLTSYVARCRKVFTADFFRERDASGAASPDPIFIVGMRRSGSTLVEQILASHSQVEGTRELDDLAGILDDFMGRRPAKEDYYPVGLETIPVGGFKKLGEAYLKRAGAYRRSDRAFFTDKMGSNHLHVGLIQLILPNAKIVDVRRHPLACCFSNFVQLFSRDKKNASSFSDIAQNYRDYVALMAHFDSVLPGRVHRVIYEQLVERPEFEIRRLLDYLGLRFEASCLQFHLTERTIFTESAEQVRRPMDRSGLERWNDYEPWLGPLKSALGALVDIYPNAPAFD